MATVTVRSEATPCHGAAAARLLERYNLGYAFWGTDRLPPRLRAATVLGEAERTQILAAYAAEIKTLKERHGYCAEDIITLASATPGLETLLAKFRLVHHHADDEVRFVIGGSGLFTVYTGSTVLDVTLSPGDLITIPAFTRHRFDLTAEQRIVCARIFKDPAGWAAIYDTPTVVQPA